MIWKYDAIASHHTATIQWLEGTVYRVDEGMVVALFGENVDDHVDVQVRLGDDYDHALKVASNMMYMLLGIVEELSVTCKTCGKTSKTDEPGWLMFAKQDFEQFALCPDHARLVEMFAQEVAAGAAS